MKTLRFIPEYAPMRKLALCFVDVFFNQRFHYGRAHAQIIRACRGVQVEMHLEPGEMEAFRAAVSPEVLTLPYLTLDTVSPGRAIMLEAAPIYAEDADTGAARYGMIFHNPRLDEDARLYAFARWMAEQNGFTPLEPDFPFATAQLLVNEDVVLLSAGQFQTAEDECKLRFFQEHFPGYHFHIVPPLTGDLTDDLDMYLWSIAPKVWIASQYPAGSAQEHSISPALDVLAHYGHRVHRVPGLEPIIYEDINTMPNYANGVLLNRLALAPAYKRKEDGVVVDILHGYGFTVEPIDCSDIILSNSGIHCISAAIPA